MPTTTNKDYQKIKPIPEDITPNTDVFYHPSTNEIFADYDGYFERMIQLNSAGWSCAITGKSGLTYDEALESEKDAIEQINNFPAFLETPILFIVHNYICRARIDEIVGDVMAFMRDRYFMDEEVVYRQTSHRRFHCRVIGIDYNGGNGSDQNINGKMNNKVNEVGISKSTSKSPAKKGNEQIGMELIPAECFTYTLQILNSKNGSDSSDSDNEESGRNNAKGKDKMPGQVFKISHLQIGRGRATFATRSRIKLFIRYYVEMSDGKLIVKPNFVVDFKLESLRWSQIFCKCPEPKFPQTRSNKKIKLESFENFEEAEKKYLNVSDRPGTSKETEKNAKKTANVKNAEFRKKRIYEQQIHLEPLFKQADKFGVQNMERWRQHFQFLSDDDIQELRLAIAEAKEMERKRQIEQRKKEREAIIEWRKPRDDLQCEDLEPFPDFKAFTWPEWIPRQFYWDIISIYSFFNNFAEVLFLDHTSPFTVCNVATAIVSHRVTEKAQFYQILDWLMTAVNKSLEEDEGSPADLSRPEQIGTESNKDIDHPVHGQNIREINKICEKQKRIHGVHIHAFTRSLLDITEVIRIHLLTSGYYTQYRRQLRGNMHCYEDDGYLFAKKENKIMDLLEKSTIFALSPRARIKLINVLMNQLLSHRRCRDLIEKRSEELANLKREFRHLKTVDQQHEKEARDGHQFLLHQNKAIDNGQNAIGGEGLKPSKSISKDLTNLRRALIQLNEGRRVQNIVEIKERMLSEENPLPWTQMENVNEIHEFRAVQRNFHSDKMQEILKSIYELQGKMGMYYLGRDRAFRRYYYMCSAFVIKCPKLGKELGECGKATQVKNKTEENSNGDAKLAKEENNGENKELVEDNMADNNGMEMPKIDPLMACSGSMQNCPVHNPSEDAPKLLYYLEKDAPKKLIHALNPRGFRELELAENIGLFKEIYSREMIETENAFAERKGLPLSSQLFGFSSLLPKELTKDGGMDGENPRIADALLGEVKKRLLELEESIYERKLGTLKCRGGREEWRKALEERGDTIELCSVDGIPISNASNTAQLLYTKEELNSPLTPVQKLGIALIQLVHSIHPECFHSLFFSEIKKNGAVIKRNPSRTFEEWQKALKSCQSPSAVGLFEATFEYAVNWEFNQTEEKKENLTNKIGRVHRQPKSAPSSTKILPNNSKPSTSGSHRYREAEQLMANAAHLLVTGTRQRKPVTKYGECEMDIDKLDLDGDEDENEWDSNDAYDQEEEDDDDEEGDGNSNDEDKFLNGFGAERYEGLSRKRKAVTHFDPTNYHTESNKRNKEEEEEEEEIIVDEGDSDNNDEKEKGQNEDEGGRELEEWEYYG